MNPTGNCLIFEAAGEAATDEFGAALAKALPDSAVVALIGPLGAGKTRLVRAIALAAGVEQEAIGSPTFVLIHEYAGRVPIFHFDAYRLTSADEFVNLGAEEYFHKRGWSLIEWADRVAQCLPADRLEIVIEPLAETARRFTVSTLGPGHAVTVAALERDLAETKHFRKT
jgi:tRNA threonylcarbamoyladenosine biosynthesis protein TsaE